MINFESHTKINEEVYHSSSNLLFLEKKDINNLIEIAKLNKRKRARLCSHLNSDEVIQEMIIVHPRGAYVRPHKHINKIESMMILEGEVDFILFNENGKIKDKVEMGDYSSGKAFYDSVRESTFHSLHIKSDWLVFLEITKGPFKKDDTIFASWSPVESNFKDVELFMKKVLEEV